MSFSQRTRKSKQVNAVLSQVGDAFSILLCSEKHIIKNTLGSAEFVYLCTYQFVTSTSHPGTPPGIWFFFFFSAVKFPSPGSESLFKCPTCKTRWMGKCPTPGPFFRHLIAQDRFKTIRYNDYRMVFFKLKLDKGTSVYIQKRPWVSTAHFWSAIPSRTQYLVR